jgi:hypothetical protein
MPTYNYTRTATRPNTNVSYYTQSPETTEYIKVTYKDTGKLVSTIEMSPDGLTETRTYVWASVEDWQEFIVDPVIQNYLMERDSYNASNGIVSAKVV